MERSTVKVLLQKFCWPTYSALQVGTKSTIIDDINFSTLLCLLSVPFQFAHGQPTCKALYNTCSINISLVLSLCSLSGMQRNKAAYNTPSYSSRLQGIAQ
jgi:hypothetical protein